MGFARMVNAIASLDSADLSASKRFLAKMAAMDEVFAKMGVATAVLATRVTLAWNQ